MHVVQGRTTGTTFLQGNVTIINYPQLSKRNHINVYFSPKVAYLIDTLLCHANPKYLKKKFKALKSIDPTSLLAKKQFCLPH